MVAIKQQRFSGYGLKLRSAQLLHEALRMLRVWESQWQDLSYPEGDPRRLMFSSEIPQDWHDARRELAEAVVFHAAMFAGESEADADSFADTPEALINPFRVERVRLAASLCWNFKPLGPTSAAWRRAFGP